jgi:hypothetical protein
VGTTGRCYDREMMSADEMYMGKPLEKQRREID